MVMGTVLQPKPTEPNPLIFEHPWPNLTQPISDKHFSRNTTDILSKSDNISRNEYYQ